MNKPLSVFITTLTLVLLVVFGIHILLLYLNKIPLFEHKISLAYGLNYGLAMIAFWILFTYRNKLKNLLGFIFMGFSFLKFLLFYLFFYHSYVADGKMSTIEFATFFIPYFICLVIEVLSLSKLLNKLS